MTWLKNLTGMPSKSDQECTETSKSKDNDTAIPENITISTGSSPNISQHTSLSTNSSLNSYIGSKFHHSVVGFHISDETPESAKGQSNEKNENPVATPNMGTKSILKKTCKEVDQQKSVEVAERRKRDIRTPVRGKKVKLPAVVPEEEGEVGRGHIMKG